MKKVFAVILCAVCLLSILTACGGTTSKAYTFTVDNGDKIKVALDTTDGYDISSEVPFAISCDGQTLSQGTFILAEDYQLYVDAVKADANATVLDSGTKDGNQYLFWNYNGSEYNYAILIEGSGVAIVLGNPISEESAKTCFDRLTITVAD